MGKMVPELMQASTNLTGIASEDLGLSSKTPSGLFRITREMTTNTKWPVDSKHELYQEYCNAYDVSDSNHIFHANQSVYGSCPCREEIYRCKEGDKSGSSPFDYTQFWRKQDPDYM